MVRVGWLCAFLALGGCGTDAEHPKFSGQDAGIQDGKSDGNGDSGSQPDAASPPPPCVPMPNSAPPTGSLDAVTDLATAGWARDPDWDGPILVHLYFDDHLADMTVAGLPRDDVGAHAFHQPHESFGSGTHQVKAFAIGVDRSGCPDGNNVLIGGPTFVNGDCANLPALYSGWCTAVPHYFRDKFQDTVRLAGPNVVAGINLSYGGALVELYGKDKGWNLINEQGGAAVQLSIWAYGANKENELTTLPGKGTPCAGAIDGTAGFTWPFNPIQMQQINCSWEEAYDASNDVDGWSGDNGVIVTQLDDVVNYTGSLPMPGVKFQQTTQVVNDAFVKLNYHAVNFGTVPITDPHPQETPAIFAHIGDAIELSYYGGGAPWTGDAVTTMPYTGGNGRFGVLGRNITGAPQTGQITEGWYSVCAADHAHCVTVATPLVNSSEIWEANVSHNVSTGNVYLSPIGYYAFAPGTAHDAEVYLFPYRFDEVVSGKTVREWIEAQR